MIINQQTLQTLFVGYQKYFDMGFSSAETVWRNLCTVIPSTTRTEHFNGLSSVPQLSTWDGARKVSNVKFYDYSITNASFQTTIEVPRDDVEDDSFGLFSPMMQMLGFRAATHPDKLLYDAIAAGDGTTGLCYDGQQFFDTDHPSTLGASGSQSNNVDEGGVLTVDTFMDAYQTMLAFKDDQGEPMYIQPTHLITPLALMQEAQEVLKGALRYKASTTTPYNPTAISNVAQGMVEHLVLPRLDDDSTSVWYLADLSKPVKPFIMLMRRNPEFVAFEDPSQERVWKNNTFTYSVDYRGALGYGEWRTMLRCY